MVKNILGVVVVAALVIGVKFWNMSSDSEDIKNEMRDIVHTLPCYADNAEYVDSLFDRYHSEAFHKAYDAGGRRRRATFDEDKYVVELYGQMVKMAEKAGKEELAECLASAADILVALPEDDLDG